jgi:hypothetical protein
MAVPRSHRAFCRALLEETRGDVQRMASINSVATRLGLEYEAAEVDDAGLVRVRGGHNAWLTHEGRELLKKSVVRRPSKQSGKARAKARGGRSA